MNDNQRALPTKQEIENLKYKAKKFAKENHISHAKALDIMVLPFGYRNWSLFIQDVNKQRHAQPQPTVQVIGLSKAEEPIVIVPEVTSIIAANKAIDISPTNKVAAKKITKKTLATTAAKKAPKVREWMTASYIAKQYALTIPKVKKELEHHGYMDAYGQPTPKAIADAVVKSEEKPDTYNGGLYWKHSWSNNIVTSIFKPASEVDVFCYVTSRHGLLSRVEQLFTRAGKAIGINYNGYDPTTAVKLKLTSAEYEACIEAFNHDMHFLGNPLVFLDHGVSKKEAKSIWDNNILPVANGLHTRLLSKNKKEAAFFKDALDTLMIWWLKQC